MIKRYGYMRGQSFELVQFANDWISANAPNGELVILNPLNIEIEGAEEMQRFLDEQHTGLFWSLYELYGNRLIRRKKLTGCVQNT